MNAHLFRLVFNAVRGQVMAVSEVATSSGKSASGDSAAANSPVALIQRAQLAIKAVATSVIKPIAFAIAILGLPMVLQAQVVADPSAANNLRPQIFNTANAVTQVNIQTEARLAAAACALVHCADGVPKDDPSYAYLKGMQNAGENLSEEKALLSKQTAYINRNPNEPLFSYTGVDEYIIDPFTQNKMGTRVAGTVQATAGAVGVGASGGLCTTGFGCALGAVTGGVSLDYLYSGAKQAATGNATVPYGEQVLQSLGLSPQAAAYTYAALGLAPAAVDAVVVNKAANEAAKYNQLAKASYSKFTPQGVTVTDDMLATPQVQSLMKEAQAASPAASSDEIGRRVAQWLESGTTLPSPATAAPGSVLIKVVPKGDGVSPYSPFWMSPEQARAIGTLTPAQAGQALGLPAEQAAKMLSGGLDYYAITPKAGVMPKVFVSDVAVTTQGAVTTAPSSQQVIVPNRSLWTDPKPVNPFTLR